MRRPSKRSRSPRAQSSMALGRCSMTESSTASAPGTWRQMSCFRSAQSIPTKAANVDSSSCMVTSWI